MTAGELKAILASVPNEARIAYRFENMIGGIRMLMADWRDEESLYVLPIPISDLPGLGSNMVGVDAPMLAEAIRKKKAETCQHEYFKCQVPSGDSCVPIYHQVCRLCRWDATKKCVMWDNIWKEWAIPQIAKLEAGDYHAG